MQPQTQMQIHHARGKAGPNRNSNNYSLVDKLILHAANSPFKPFLVIQASGTTQQFSYRDALQETRRWAQILAHCGAQREDRVFIALKHRAEIYFSFLGAMWIGAIPTIIPFPTPKQDPHLYWAEYTRMLSDVDPRVLVTYGDNVPNVRAALAGSTCVVLDADSQERLHTSAAQPHDRFAPEPDAIALLQFSSGTTGLRKGVALSHRQIARHMQAYGRAIEFGPGDTIASWLPLYHDMGLVACFLMPLSAGATIVSLDAFEWVAKPHMLLEAIETYRAGFIWLPNFAFHHILRTLPGDSTFKLGHVRAIINCSETCRPGSMEQFADIMAPHGVRREQLQVCYAMAETVFAVTQTALGRPPRTLAVDRRLIETSQRVRIVDASHQDARQFLSCGQIVGDLDIRIASQNDATDAIRNDRDGPHGRRPRDVSRRRCADLARDHGRRCRWLGLTLPHGAHGSAREAIGRADQRAHRGKSNQRG